jgi:hypothetical protein
MGDRIVNKRGIDEFKFRDSPKDLQIKGMAKKARGRRIIKRVEKMVGYSVWKFEEHERIN